MSSFSTTLGTSLDFTIPLNLKDLQNKSGCDQYAVDEVLPKRILATKVQEFRQRLRVNGSAATVTYFDTFYSILSHFHEIPLTLKEEAWEMLIKASTTLVKELESCLDSDTLADVRAQQLAAMKMNVYLLCQYMDVFEKEASEPSAMINAKGKKRKKTVTSDDINWSGERDLGLKALLNILQLNIQRLWSPPVAEEDFVSLVSNISYKMLENPDVTKEKSTREIIFHILGTLVKRYTHSLSCCIKIVQLLQHFEHLAVPLARCCEVIVNQYGNKSVIHDVVREISRIDSRDLVRDASGTRTYSAFLVEVSVLMPKLATSSMVLLIPMLSEEPYTMRNCVLAMTGEIVLRELSVDGLDDKSRDLRDELLDILEGLIHDINAFTRSRALQMWTRIVAEKALPLTRQTVLLELVIGRLMDKSSNVRKNAVVLLSTMLRNNPFTPKLTGDEMHEAYQSELQKLKDLQKRMSNSKDSLTEAAEQRWDMMSKALSDVIPKILEEKVEQEHRAKCEELLEDDTPERVYDRILEGLTTERYEECVEILIAGRTIHDDNPNFQYIDNKLRAIVEHSGSDVDSGTEDEEPSETEQLLGCLRTMFFSVQKLPIYQDSTSESDEEREEASGDGAEVERPPVDAAGGSGSVPATSAEPVDKEKLHQEIIQQKILVRYLKDSSVFAALVARAVPTVCQLLGSKTLSDVLEAVQFFVTGFEFGLASAMLGIRQMLPLIWSKETAIKEAVIQAYKKLYLEIAEGQTDIQYAQAVANNLIALIATSAANLDYLTSLEELVSICTESGEITAGVIQTLWKRFTLKITNTTPEESHAALKLLVMAATNSDEIVKSNISILVSEGLGERAESNLNLGKDACEMLAKLGQEQKGPRTKQSAPYRLAMDHEIFERIKYLLVSCAGRRDVIGWISFCQAAVTLTYKLAEHPDVICADVVKQIINQLFCSPTEPPMDEPTEPPAERTEPPAEPPESEEATGDSAASLSECDASHLTNLIYLLGEVALRQLVHLDVSVCKELKRRQTQQLEKQEKRKKSEKQRKSLGENSKKELDADEDMLGQTTADDAEAEYIRNLTEMNLVTGPHLLSRCSDLIITVCSDKKRFPDAHLQAAACIALSKYMLVSSVFCESHLQLLFTILERSPHDLIRANTIITTGDLMFRYPNLMVPWTPHLYARLRDSSCLVRKNTIMVLTHLILNDMVKVKGQISELAICIVDDNELIANRAQLFFSELSKKGNAVYNIMPDLISRLSDPEAGVKETDFKIIMNHLFSFIQKERQCESLVEKLCIRFRATVNERQWRDLALCLSLLSFSDRCLRKLQENFTCFNDKLYEEEVYSSFCSIMTASKKFAKPETRELVEELESRINACHEKGVDDDQAMQKANVAKNKKKQGKSRRTLSRRVEFAGSGDDSDAFTPGKGDGVGLKSASRKSSRQSKGGRRPPIVFSSDDDSGDLGDIGDSSDSDIENINPNHTGSTPRKGPKGLKGKQKSAVKKSHQHTPPTRSSRRVPRL